MQMAYLTEKSETDITVVEYLTRFVPGLALNSNIIFYTDEINRDFKYFFTILLVPYLTHLFKDICMYLGDKVAETGEERDTGRAWSGNPTWASGTQPIRQGAGPKVELLGLSLPSPKLLAS